MSQRGSDHESGSENRLVLTALRSGAPDMAVPGGGLVEKMESIFVAGVTDTVTKVASGNSPATCRSFPQGWEIGREYQVREPLLNRKL